MTNIYVTFCVDRPYVQNFPFIEPLCLIFYGFQWFSSFGITDDSLNIFTFNFVTIKPFIAKSFLRPSNMHFLCTCKTFDDNIVTTSKLNLFRGEKKLHGCGLENTC